MENTFSIVSLGCFRNAYDSQRLGLKFQKQGFRYLSRFDFSGPCDRTGLLVINTCGFIDDAKRESLSAIELAIALKKKKKIGRIAVYGCLTQRYRRQLARSFPEVDEWHGVLAFDRRATSGLSLGEPFSGFVKITEGCANQCSFCAIPLIKGGLQSKPAPAVLKEVGLLDRRGVAELNIIGQDITSWGRDLEPRQDFSSLLSEVVSRIKRIRWVRLIYTHPRHVNDRLLEIIASHPRVCKYIDLPIQHISDRILKAMNRGTSSRELKALIEKIRRRIPGCAIRTTVIVGFPGEREKDFRELLAFLKAVRFERLGAFGYSREEGTAACRFKDQIHPGTKARRLREVLQLQKTISADFQKSLIGRNLEVLVEQHKPGLCVARTQYDAPEVDGQVFIQKARLRAGDFYTAKIVDALEYDLIAR